MASSLKIVKIICKFILFVSFLIHIIVQAVRYIEMQNKIVLKKMMDESKLTPTHMQRACNNLTGNYDLNKLNIKRFVLCVASLIISIFS